MNSESNTSSFLDAYMRANINLATTLVVASSVSAKRVNDWVRKTTGRDPSLSGKQTWKYYMNICGLYHSTDEIMTVTSLDTLEEIAFTKENLKLHTGTAKEYRFPSRYYYSLVNRFPEQEPLICGILNPADMQTAISAQDGTILAYPPEYVEEQEYSLIADLQQYIRNHMTRWYVQAYGITDNLYPAVYHGCMMMGVYPKLLNLRLKRARTIQAHSFHIQQELASHYGLDKHATYLNREQALWLYRNVRYLQRNAGFNSTFKLMVEKLLTARNIPLVEYSIRQLNTFDEEILPNVFAKRKPVNEQINTTQTGSVKLVQMFEKEKQLNAYNTDFYDQRQTDVSLSIQTAQSSVTGTKLLESSMVDYTDLCPDPQPAVLMREWMSAVDRGDYTSAVTFKDPQTTEPVTLYVDDALRYYVYVLYNAFDVPVGEFPVISLEKTHKVVTPTYQEVTSLIPSTMEDIRDLCDQVYAAHSDLRPSRSISSFNTQAVGIYEQCQAEWALLANVHDMDVRGALDLVIDSFYENKIIALAPEGYTAYEDWLNAKSLPRYNYTTEQAGALMDNIFQASTGYSLDTTKSLNNVHAALIAILLEFSSYTLKCIREINDSAIVPLHGPSLRIGNIKGYASSQETVIINTSILAVDSYAQQSETIEAKLVDQSFGLGKATSHHEVSLPDEIQSSSTMTIQQGLLFPAHRLAMSYPGYDHDACERFGFYGAELYLALTDEQKSQLVDIYTNRNN